MSRPMHLCSVWSTGQLQARAQRGTRYARLSLEHPAKMLPAIARHAITTFTRPGETVLDPLCGIGTTLVEAAYLGRDGLGFELEPKWASIARHNLRFAQAQGAEGEAEVRTGDAARLAHDATRPEPAGRAALLLTSPPYASVTHGMVRSARDGAASVDKWSYRYSRTRDRANLAHQPTRELLASFTDILAACRPLLMPGAHVVITTRPFRTGGALVDFPGQTMAAAEAAGLERVGRCAALMCALRDGTTVARSSFFASLETSRLRRRDAAAHVIQHEDALILRNPTEEVE
ncbi:TRM11 family SAM-dependent methyltransferase [Streptomonospora salina]|uniref:Methyltransferase n=1 Tax=Streptomonospora salina TaxID=104205 RepID=A0A841E3K6_9ACTN|nr:DNA methyltransferase [Streptomonospora salina]MBB5998427.1 SAM-dependent methyltransferase [Streptomonospora salina]